MMLYDLDSELIIAKMSRVLNGVGLASPDARAARQVLPPDNYQLPAQSTMEV